MEHRGEKSGSLRIALVLLAAAHALPAERWWEQEPLRILDLGTVFGQIAERPPAELAAQKAVRMYNAEHFNVMGFRRGLDDAEFYFASKLAARANRDYLREYLPEARKRGLRVLIYFNVHWYNREFGEKHRDWLQIRESGGPMDTVYDTGVSFCVNSPWREWCFQVLRDLAAYPIDGVFYDGPIFFPDTCYCRWCREKFRKAHGKDLPSKKERRGQAFRELVDFQARSLADYLRDSRQALKSVNPEALLYMNGGLRGANWATARLNRVLVAEQDLLGAEGGFISGDLTRVPLWKPGVTARLLETQAPDKPRVIFSAASHKPWTFSILPGAELRLLYADTIANAASVWFGITRFEFDQPENQALTEMNRFLAKHGPYYKDTRSEARVALVWSDTTANFYAGADAQLIDIDRIPQRSDVGNLDGEFNGLAEALVRGHTPFDVIDDVALEGEGLSRYQTIFLPNVACMSDRTAARLREYARGGGRLFATFETSLYDDTGIRRGDFALADVFGVADARRIVGPLRWDFMKLAGAKHALLEGLERAFLPAPAYHVRVKPNGAQPLLYFTEPLAGRYDGVPPVSGEPALLVHPYGRGMAVYFSGDLGNQIQAFHLGQSLTLIENAIRELAPSPVRLEGAPGSVEVVLRSQENGRRLLLHLVNFTGEMTRPIQRVLPLEDVRVALGAGAPVKRVFTLVGGRTLAIAQKGSEAQFTIPRVAEYEVVVIEK